MPLHHRESSHAEDPPVSGGDDPLDRLAHEVRHAGRGVVALTGAGISIASGVPSFRGTGGLWERHDPAEVATIAALRRDPERVWRFLRELDAVLLAAQPNPAHTALASLEERGLLRGVITQNVDGLHQAAGSRQVIELHGHTRSLHCIDCGLGLTREEAEQRTEPSVAVPSCPVCDGVLKPDVTLFGEALPAGAMRRAEHLVRHCDVLLVVGTSAEVYPAAQLPELALRHGARLWEINPVPELAEAARVPGTAERILPLLSRRVSGGGWWRGLRQAVQGLDPRRWID